MISFLPYISEFRKYAETNNDIIHSETNKRFFRMNLNEIQGDIRSKIDADSRIMVLESYQHNSKDLESDNHLRDYTGAFLILEREKKIDNYDQQDIIIDGCELTAIEISKKIYADSLNYDNRFFTDIDLGTFTFQKVGPLFNSWYGIRCQFDFDDKYDINVDPLKWTDIEDPPVEPIEGQFSMIVNIDGTEIYNEVWESQDSNTINIT